MGAFAFLRVSGVGRGTVEVLCWAPGLLLRNFFLQLQGILGYVVGFRV